MIALRLACLLASALLLVSAEEEDKGIFDCLTGPCVTVPGVGKLQGSKKTTQFTGREVFGFWSIPFGETTGGENRFAPPVPKAPLNDGKDAFDASYTSYILSWFNNVCPQPGVELTGKASNPFIQMMMEEHPIPEEKGILSVLGTEDCLKLAVFTPELPTAQSNPKLPVMVYIHGGAFMMGGYIAAGPGKLLEKDVVLVEMQYRLGPLGFMCLPDDDIAGNMGLLDQTLALQWVRDHIAAFGGDPDRVTIFGESAGSASVTYHMLSPLSLPYFEQAIAESGSALNSWAFDTQPEKHAQDIGTQVGCTGSSTAELVNCFKNEKSVDDIVSGHKTYYLAERAKGQLGFGGSSPCAQTHGRQKFITKHPKQYIMDQVSSGASKTIPAMFGANKHEGSFVLGLMYNTYLVPNNVLSDNFFLEHFFTSTLLAAMGLQDTSGNIYEMLDYTFFNHADMGTWETMMDGMVNLVGTFFIKSATYEFMKYNQINGANSWFYSFEYYGEASLWNFLFPNESPPIPRGVTHGDELLYLFSTGVFNLSEPDWDMAWKMVNLWTNFAIHGDPTPAGNTIPELPAWPHFNEDEMPYLVLNEQCTVEYNYVKTWANPDRVGI